MTTNEMTNEKAALLRKEFPKEVIGKLPKGGTMLDFVGHAAVTDRLLQVDPQWSWEPLALDDHGLPATDDKGNFWIKLTICGVTRLGVGDGPTPKERIGDAIRNAAMRFGVALDLWAREDLSAMHREPLVTKDPAWVKETLKLVSTCTADELDEIGADVKREVSNGNVSDADREALGKAFIAAKKRTAEA